MGWLQETKDELKLLFAMMVGISPSQELQERTGILHHEEGPPPPANHDTPPADAATEHSPPHDANG